MTRRGKKGIREAFDFSCFTRYSEKMPFYSVRVYFFFYIYPCRNIHKVMNNTYNTNIINPKIGVKYY